MALAAQGVASGAGGGEREQREATCCILIARRDRVLAPAPTIPTSYRNLSPWHPPRLSAQSFMSHTSEAGSEPARGLRGSTPRCSAFVTTLAAVGRIKRQRAVSGIRRPFSTRRKMVFMPVKRSVRRPVTGSRFSRQIQSAIVHRNIRGAQYTMASLGWDDSNPYTSNLTEHTH